ncbi:MAG: hypothetical protein N2554_05700 [Fimbriimonadales bacterium]|nr:hypothetical protein [Fimbriimonadales bacterium]
MRRWAIRTAQLLSVLWATLFLSVSLLHPLTHNPLQAHHGDCLACVLQKTPAPKPPALHDALHAPVIYWGDQQTLPNLSVSFTPDDSDVQPLIPRAPPI